MAALATVADVEARWRPGSFTDQAIIGALLTDASAIVRREFPTIDARVLSSEIDADVVTLVVAGMVGRVLRNRFPSSVGAFDQDAPAAEAWETAPRLSAADRRLLGEASPILVGTFLLGPYVEWQPCEVDEDELPTP